MIVPPRALHTMACRLPASAVEGRKLASRQAFDGHLANQASKLLAVTGMHVLMMDAPPKRRSVAKSLLEALWRWCCFTFAVE